MANDSVEQIKDRLDIVDIIGQTVQLRKAGRSFKGLCPFHQEKTPSFIVFPESQTFHCFGCHAGGDLFNYVMQQDRIDFSEALTTLARQAGVELEERTAREDAPPPDQYDHLYDLNQRAASFFSHVLWRTSHGEEGRKLLEERGVDQQTAETFQLGFAPDRWDALLTRFRKNDVPVEHAMEAGLVTENDSGRTYDRFRNRLMFPISDADGRIIGFGARALGDAMPKYLNSPQSPIFDKSSSLYALDLARDAIREKRDVVVVEGYMDAIAAHQHGYRNVVASMGTALTEQQVRLIRRGVDRIILALDSDVAGQMATIRGLDVMRDTLSEDQRAVVDGPNIVRFEKQMKTDIRIVKLPEGTDPDDLIRSDRENWERLTANPIPFLDFYVDAVIGDPPPTDPREKSEIVNQLGPVLREISDNVVREHYVGQAARKLGLSERVILTSGASPRRQRQLQPAQVTRPTPATPEEHLVGLLIRYPEFLGNTLDRVVESDIHDPRSREALTAIRHQAPDTIPGIIEGLPEQVREHVERLIESIGERPQTYPGQLRREAEQVLTRLRKQRHDQQIRQLMSDLNHAESEKDRDTVVEHLALIDQMKTRYPEFYPEKSPYFRDSRDTGLPSG
ncbi:MAG: DNA primase [Sphaerobacteraceae bacterium]|nr:MAG: DNA primase [Sphaerobacteraceae bacterium]